MKAPSYRYLRGYSLDPGFSTRLDTSGINEVVYQVPFEHVAPGPVGEYLEVMDFDPASGTWYDPVDLGDDRVASQNGLAPSEGNPQFHQQLCYAVGMKTIRHFERALGRKIIWPPRLGRRRRANGGAAGDLDWTPDYVQRLRIYPHAIRDANAYYDPEKAALLFGYFTAAAQAQGTNFPGGVVFTCLSPDIVAHETSHAILDSIHHRYLEDTNEDVAAFHEGFADIVALLQRFTFRDLVEHQLASSGGRLDGPTVLGQLATQFGEALEGNRGALRSMIGTWTDDHEWVPIPPGTSDYEDNVECHDRGAVLVATIFDAFVRLYRHRTADLLRIATGGTGKLAEGAIDTDLVRRLAAEACEIAEHLLHICIRALDYCPPTDIKFGTYLRALITADIDIAPEDESGFRVALIEAFRARGIYPSRVNTLSVESLCWDRPEFTRKQQDTLNWITAKIKPQVRTLVETRHREELFKRSRTAQGTLNNLLKRGVRSYKPDEWEAFLNRLGLTARPVSELFGPHSREVRFLRDGKPDAHYTPKIECHTIRPAFRTGREGRQIEQVLVTLTQRVTVDVGEPKAPRPMVFRGGCSLILSLGELNRAEYVIVKNIKSWPRFTRQAEYFNGDRAGGARRESMYAEYDRDWRVNFNLLHGRLS